MYLYIQSKVPIIPSNLEIRAQMKGDPNIQTNDLWGDMGIIFLVLIINKLL